MEPLSRDYAMKLQDSKLSVLIANNVHDIVGCNLSN